MNVKEPLGDSVVRIYKSQDFMTDDDDSLSVQVLKRN